MWLYHGLSDLNFMKTDEKIMQEAKMNLKMHKHWYVIAPSIIQTFIDLMWRIQKVIKSKSFGATKFSQGY